ncbi:MAG: hypothetical protein ABIH72_05910 [archaeon]
METKRVSLLLVAVILLLALTLVAFLSIKKDKNILLSPEEDMNISGSTEENNIENITETGNESSEYNTSSDEEIIGFSPGSNCTDSDLGKNYYLRGQIIFSPQTGNNISYNDSCEDYNLLKEYYCNETNDIENEQYNCNISCLNGACESLNICIDTDFGANYNEKGTTFGRNISSPLNNITAEDYCSGDDLIEYFCRGSYIDSEIYECSNSCINGACNSSNCAPSWTQTNTTCKSNNRLEIYFTDSNSCSQTPPANQTAHCDYDGNGLIGNLSSFSSSNIYLSVYINGSQNSTQQYTGTFKVEFKDGNDAIIEFDWNFASPLDFEDIYIEKQGSSSSQGYLLIKKISANKKVSVDKKSSSSNSVCVKKAEVNSTSDITSNCNGTNEVLVACPGANSGISCSPSSTDFLVEGVTNSLIIEYLGNATPAGGCSPSWDCEDWSACANSLQTRVCNDLNYCNTTSQKPEESQICASECEENWDCEDWPSDCPKNKTLTRACNDLNSCGTSNEKPLTSKSCEQGSNLGYIVLIIIIALLAIIIALAIIYLLKKQKEDSSGNTLSKSSPPFGPFSPQNRPVNPPMQRTFQPKPGIYRV